MKDLLENLYFVDWDRYTSDGFVYLFYGWIKREEDEYKDFVTVEYNEREKRVITFCTSSKKYSLAIAEILTGSSEGHIDCQRVEHLIDIFNSIKE